MAEAPTLSQDEEDEVGEGAQNWVVISGKDEEEEWDQLWCESRARNVGGGEPRHGARNQHEWETRQNRVIRKSGVGEGGGWQGWRPTAWALEEAGASVG